MRSSRRRPPSLVACALAGALAGCGPLPPPPEGIIKTVPLDVTVSVDVATRHQVMQGFGGSIAFYVNYVARHPQRSLILQSLFVDLGIQMLRIGNWYQNNNDSGASGLTDTVAVVEGATAALGRPPLIEMSSWSPPATLKSTRRVQNGGTLAPAVAGGDRYADFAQWWVASLSQYAAAGVVPDYISIQNEPDFVAAGWQTCLFDPTENATNAGYDKALDAVAVALAAGGPSPPPKLLGPESAGIGGTRLANYMTALEAGPGIGEIEGIAHHLYNGAVGTSFDFAMDQVAGMGAAANKPLFMTEYGPTAPNMFDTAWLINSALTIENVSAYLYWPLTWVAPPAGQVPTALITTESPTNTAGWKSPNGFIINDLYYGVRHFSKWIEPGWQRVGTSSPTNVVGLSAFASPDGARLTIVLLNNDADPHSVTLDLGAFSFASSAVYRTSGSDERTTPVGPLTGPVLLAPRSLATVTLEP